jgi:hypothetical protein
MSQHMASRVTELRLDDYESVQSWLMGFEAKAKVNKIDDVTTGGVLDNAKAMKFLSLAGVAAITKLRDINMPVDIMGLTYDKLKSS